MTYTINPKDPEALLHVLGEASCELGNEGHLVSQSVIDELRDQLREQVKPAVEEPREFASVVCAGVDGLVDRVLWQRGPGGRWTSENGAFTAAFSWLDHPEVLRVGLGGDYREGLHDGRTATVASFHAYLISRLDQAITAERKHELEKAIQAVEELAP